ncbi:MAG: 3'-5' exonuclease [Candidatus Methylomirabilia bacterium]
MPSHLMVDLETLGAEPGVVIVSIGALKFDADGQTLGEEFYTNIMIQSCLDAGLSVEGRTIQWWMEQSDEARQALFRPDPLPLRAALAAFSDFYKGSDYIWSHGSTFDVPILGAAYRALDEDRPWSWTNIRDTRTLFSLVPQSVLDSVPCDGIKHHALHDAIRQARMVQAAYGWLRTARA